MATLDRMQILLADDGSQHSQASLALLRDLELPRESQVTVLGVFSPRQVDTHETLRAALERTKASLLEKGCQATAECILGYPAEKVIEYADRLHPDLIVMGAKGLRATLGILLGGVAQTVVEYANWPVLVVRAPYGGLHKTLLVVDGSIYSQRAVEYLAHFPLPAGVELLVCHVLPPLVPPMLAVQSQAVSAAGIEMIAALPDTMQEEPAVWQEEEERQGQAILKQALDTLQAAGLKAETFLLRGDAATEIIEYVKAHGVDLIVAGSRGLSQVRGWLLGSVSRKLIHYASCSVLVVKHHQNGTH
jgi:nucleotide-binding universal stress UspA family protein